MRFATQGRFFDIPAEEDIYSLLRYLALAEPLSHEMRAPNLPVSGGDARIIFSLELRQPGGRPS